MHNMFSFIQLVLLAFGATASVFEQVTQHLSFRYRSIYWHGPHIRENLNFHLIISNFGGTNYFQLLLHAKSTKYITWEAL